MISEELFLNVRRAYRLLYEVQDSARKVANYYSSKLDFIDYAGLQLFSNFPEKKKPSLDDYADIKVYPYKWIWDLFPCYMFEYYFASKDGYRCMPMVCVMDDGAFNARNILDTSTYIPVEDSSSYILFTYSKYNGTESDRIWYYNLYPDISESRDAIFRLGKDLKNTADGLFECNNEKGHIITARYPMDLLMDQQKSESALEGFAEIIKERFGDSILKAYKA